MADKIDAATEELTAALASFERSKASLYRPDGSMKYSEAEHQERLKVFTETLHGVAQRVDDAVEAELAAVRRLEEAEHTDPGERLTAAELATANAKALFVREDCERLPLPQLLTRLRGVLAAGEHGPDKPTAFVWARYAAQRVAGELERARAGSGPAPMALLEQVGDIEAAIATLTAVVAPASGITKVEARRRMVRAREARRAAHQRVHEADGTREQLMAAMAQRYQVF